MSEPQRQATGSGRSPRRDDHSFASANLRDHVLRGLVGFGALIVAWRFAPVAGWWAIVPLGVGVVALRGCPTCWTIGLIQTVSRRRFRRVCTEGTCRLEDGRTPPDPGAERLVDTVRV